MQNLYLTFMYRWGNIESHCYPVGIFTSLEAAQKAGEEEFTWRGSKYEYEIYRLILDQDYSGNCDLEYEVVHAISRETKNRHLKLHLFKIMGYREEPVENNLVYYGA